MKRSTVLLCSLATMFMATIVALGKEQSGRPIQEVTDEVPDEPLVPNGTPDPAQSDALRAVKSVTIPAAAFINSARSINSGQNLIVFDPDRGYVCGRGGANGEWAQAAVYLPKGAKITNFLAYIYDNNRNATIYVSMRRVRNLTGVSDPIASVSSLAGASTGIQTPGSSAISNGNVDDLYSYWIRCYLYTEDTRVYAVKIYYEE